MKKFIQLQQNLDALEAQKQNICPMEDMSLLQFIKHKSLILKKTKLKNQMKKSLLKAQSIVLHYKNYKEKLLNDNSINCRKYSRMIKKAEYHANLELYKLGFIAKKPTPPFFQKAIKKFNLPVFKFFKHLYENITYFRSTIFPQKLDKLALQTAKTGIRGYRLLKSNFLLFGKRLSSNESAKRIHGIIKKAKAQLNNEEIMSYRNHHHANNGSFYRSTIKFDFPNPSIAASRGISQKKSSTIKTTYLEPDL